jgi:hypothetical protein
MGFRPEPTIYNLKFKDTPLDGLEVRASCCSVAEYNEMLKAAVASGGTISAETLEENDRMLQLFCNHLVSWNLEDLAGQPVPTNRAGIDSQERPLVAQLITAWQVALVNIPNPSKPDSPNGAISEELSLGLGNASESPGS